ncbi:TMhelix containing protein [Vibrio phage 2.117.O._10N.261.45.E9]|nr:TMhelix containing protein [Vibrio phage 1.117.O._10N.261.45.E9]AUR95466.1 TMhelix containing protein [Vibrio phage 1.207.B._10N.222.51.C2]AUS02357.1 TMhelix containing protein [Vibrio phage 2.117.O._10N.261.45.E9]
MRDMLVNPNKKTLIARLAVLACIKLAPFGAFIYTSAVTTNSIYIHFNRKGVKGKLRISDHPSPKYNYKWNVILGEENRVDTDNGKMIANEDTAEAFFDYMAGEMNKQVRIKESCINFAATKTMRCIRSTDISGAGSQVTQSLPCLPELGSR